MMTYKVSKASYYRAGQISLHGNRFYREMDIGKLSKNFAG